jgi:hypothetical protein
MDIEVSVDDMKDQEQRKEKMGRPQSTILSNLLSELILQNLPAPFFPSYMRMFPPSQAGQPAWSLHLSRELIFSFAISIGQESQLH